MAGLRSRVVELFAHPDGATARPMATVLNLVNKQSNRAVPAALGVTTGDVVLEVGFGGGAGLRATLAALNGTGVVHAVDLSAGMVERARREFAVELRDGRLLVHKAAVDSIPLPSQHIDKAYAVHSHMYWPSVTGGLREFHRVLRSGGRAMLAMDQLKALRLLDERFSEASNPEWLAARFTEAGFVDVEHRPIAKGKVGVFGAKSR